MEMPKPTPQHRKLEAFAGTWTGQEKMLPSPWDPKGGDARGAITSRMDLDGMYLVSDYTQERDGKITYRGHGVIGYDPKRESYTTGSTRCRTTPAAPPSAAGRATR